MTKLIPITGIFRSNLPKIKEAYVIRNPALFSLLDFLTRQVSCNHCKFGYHPKVHAEIHRDWEFSVIDGTCAANMLGQNGQISEDGADPSGTRKAESQPKASNDR